MKTLSRIGMGLALLGLGACNGAAQSEGPPAAVSALAVNLTSLAQPEPGALPADYEERAVTLRLFGTQGEGSEAFATLADTATWETRNYRVGDTLGRNLKLTAVRPQAGEAGEPGEIELTESGRVRVLRAGADLSVRLVEHVFDRAALEGGQHRWSVKGRVLARVLARYGLGATETEAVTYGSLPALRLGPVRPGSVLERLGLRRGDLLLALDGEPLTAVGLSRLGDAVTRAGGPGVLLQVVRGGSFWEAQYQIE